MGSNRNWSKTEDDILIKNVIENYDNLNSIAFPKTAIETGRSIAGCRQRWYSVAKNQSICFTSISEKRAMKNRKTLPKNYKCEDKVKKSKLKTLMLKIKKLFS